MQIDNIRSKLTTLKMHIDRVDDWLRQATDLVYTIEEEIFDVEDKEFSKKYGFNFKEAAPEIYQLIDSPPRLPSHCNEDLNVGRGFYQSDFNLKKII